MHRVINACVTGCVVVVLLAALFMALGSPADLIGVSWNAVFAQQARCPTGRFAPDCGLETRVGARRAEANLPTLAPPTSEPEPRPGISPAAGSASALPAMQAPASSRVSSLYAGAKLARFDGAQLEFVHADHLGTGAARTDAGGAVLESARQLPFGAQLGAHSRETDFTDKRADEGSTLIYFGARYLLPSIGKFVQPDPVWESSQSLYVYVQNNPLIYRDPTGRFQEPLQRAIQNVQASGLGRVIPPAVEGQISTNWQLADGGTAGHYGAESGRIEINPDLSPTEMEGTVVHEGYHRRLDRGGTSLGGRLLGKYDAIGLSDLPPEVQEYTARRIEARYYLSKGLSVADIERIDPLTAAALKGKNAFSQAWKTGASGIEYDILRAVEDSGGEMWIERRVPTSTARGGIGVLRGAITPGRVLGAAGLGLCIGLACNDFARGRYEEGMVGLSGLFPPLGAMYTVAAIDQYLQSTDLRPVRAFLDERYQGPAYTHIPSLRGQHRQQ